MNSKKITAWILSVAMLVAMMPSAFVLAAGDTATPVPYPLIVTDVFSEMTNDISGVGTGTDLDLTGTTDASLPTVRTEAGAEATLDGITGTVYHNRDSEINRMRRKQILTFVAKSQNGSNFINSSASTGVAEKAVEIAYLDANRKPLEIKLDSEEFEVMGSGDWSKAWIDLSKDVQQTDRTLDSFLTQEIDGINPKLLTAAQLFATGDMVSFMIYNVIRSDFAGYLRIKITDNNANTTVQDYPIVADGRYPAVSIGTSTYKNPVGANVECDSVTNVVENTFINEMDFVTVMEDTEANKAVNETDNIHKSYRWHSLDTAALQNALNWTDEKYKPENIWAMGDISVDKIAISDLLVSSGIKSVKYSVANYGLQENVIPSTLKGTIELTYNPETKLCSAETPIVISGEGFNVLAITAVDNSGLETTNRYYFYIDTTAPKAQFHFVELDQNVVSSEENVVSLFTVADVVTNRQQALDMSASDDVTASVGIISGLEAATAGETEKNKMYQYRLLATQEGAAEGGNVPDGYTATVLDKNGNDLSGWKIWTGKTETPVIEKEFDGIVQVRVQDRAGNWSSVVSKTSDGKETIITDNTNPVIDVKEYALNTNSDTTGNTADEIINGTAANILVTTARVTEETKGAIENEKIYTTTGDVAPWINDSAVLEVKITDANLADTIRSSGLNEGLINVKAEFNAENETKKIAIWNKNGVDKKAVEDSFDLTEDYIFGTETDKALTFYIEYEGTGVADITVSVKDKADVNDGDVFSSVYQTQLRVDKINPYITYKGFDITDDAEKDLLKENNEKVDYEVRDMPWGPNSQVIEVVVKDDDITPVQSKTKNVTFKADKALKLYKVVGGKLTYADKTYDAGIENVVTTGDWEEIANEKYESNVGYKFYLVYEGTGTAKIEFYANDSAKEPNVRDYPSAATADGAEPVLYDAMLRVDKIAPEFQNVKIVEQTDDVDDVTEFELFALDGTPDENVTRKQLKLDFDVVDHVGTGSEAGLLQSGVNYKGEIPKIDGEEVAITEVQAKYLEISSDYYDNRDVEFVDMLENGTTEEDPRIEYILLPVVEDEMPERDENSTVLDYIEAEWENADWITTWNDDIVIDKEFQGGIVLRTIDRVGNMVYSDVIQVVAESKSPLVQFVTGVPEGKEQWETLNQYGWAKRDVYFEVKVKDQDEKDVDAGIAKVVLQSDVDGVMSLNGNAIGTEAQEVSVAGRQPGDDGYISLGYVKATATSSLTVTVYDKAELYDASGAADVAETGNKTVATYNVNIDREAPVVNDEAINFTVTGNEIKLVVNTEAIQDNESGLAPLWHTDAYNKHDGFKPLYSVKGDGEKEADDQESLDYYFNSSEDIKDYNTVQSAQNVRSGYVHENDEHNDAAQWEIPGIQYALIPKNGEIKTETVDTEKFKWDFQTDPETVYDEQGYREGDHEKLVWHNYVEDQVVAEAEFDGYIIVRVVDKAGNITLLGTSSILDVEFDDDWTNETQFIQVKASERNGFVTDVEYFGNNDLLFPDGVHRSLPEALDGEGAFIEVVNEGITNVVIKSKIEIDNADPIRLSDWEGDMNIGSLGQDLKYQFVDVKIDKTAPEFDFGDGLWEDPTRETFDVKIDFVKDPVPNEHSTVMSKKQSGIKNIEWCKIPKGTSKEEWEKVKEVTIDGSKYKFEDVPDWYQMDIVIGHIEAKEDSAFDGTIKVRVTDNAGNVTEKSQNKTVDNTKPIISISNDSTGKCSHDPVTVFVTVSESAEFSDIKKVTYKAENEGEDRATIVEEGTLPLIGGTITVDLEGVTTVKVTATNKAGVSKTVETTVVIHYADRAMPTIEGHVSGDWITGTTDTTEINISSGYDFRYSVNGSTWEEVDITEKEKIIKLTPGANTIRLQAYDKNCLCKSDVNTYVINYDNGKPEITLAPGTEISTNESAVAMIIANKGTCTSEIKSLTYDLVRVVGSEYKPVETGRHLSPNGGNIVIASEGEWSINNIKVTMESGIEYTSTDHISVIVDKSAPQLEANLIPNGEKADISLFALQETQTGYDLTVKATDTFSEKVKIEYAAVAEGDAYPDWVTQTVNSGEEKVFEDVIKNAFKGSFVVKATDALGNTSVWTKNVFTEGIEPEIAVTAPSDWQTENFIVDVNVVDKGVSSTIESVTYTLHDGETAKGTVVGSGTLSSIGGSIEITREGTTTVEIVAKDYAGNVGTETRTVKLDKTAPEYSRMIRLLGVYNEHEIPESEWDIIHDGWTYNHDVSLDGIKDIHSGLKQVNIKFTSTDGSSTETTLHSQQTSSSFSERGKYELTLIDNAGNVRNISFAIDKELQNVINVVGVDEVGKLNIAVTDGNDMLTFYKKENSASKYTKMYNGVTDRLVDGKTGVRYIYGQNDSGKKSNTLYVIVAPSTEYGISFMSLNSTPNRYLSIDAESGDVTVKKIDEIFNPGINKNISVGSVVEINEDGVYSITTNN